MVADKLERQWLPEVCYAQFILQLHYTDNFQNICEKTLQMYFKVAVRNFYVFIQRRLDTYAVHVIVRWTQSDSACEIACFTFLPQQSCSHVNMAWDQG